MVVMLEHVRRRFCESSFCVIARFLSLHPRRSNLCFRSGAVNIGGTFISGEDSALPHYPYSTCPVPFKSSATKSC